MDRCALFVDAGYVLTDGAMAVHGTRRRESVSWDYAGLLRMLSSLAVERSSQPLLRCYWYEGTPDGRRTAEHEALADLPGVKMRVAMMPPGHRDGVSGEIHRDLTALARNKAVSDVMVVSAEEDLAQVIADVQDMGMRVTLLHIDDDDSRAISRSLRQECDDIVAIGAAQLRPYVELIPGAEPAYQEEASVGARALPPADDQVQYGYAPAGNHNGGADLGPATDFVPVPDFGPVPDYAAAPVPTASREDLYGAPVVLTARVEEPSDDRDRMAGRPAIEANAYAPGAMRDQYQRDAVPFGEDMGNRLQPVPVPVAAVADTSPQIRRMPSPGAGPGQGMPSRGLPPAAAEAEMGLPPIGARQPGMPQPGSQPPMGRPFAGHPTGAQPALQVAPPVDQNGMGYPDGRGGVPGPPNPMMAPPNGGPQQVPPPGGMAPGGPGPVGLSPVGPGPVGPGPVGPGPVGPGPVGPGPAAPGPVGPGPQGAMPPAAGQQYSMMQQNPMAQQMPAGPQAPGVPQAPVGQPEMVGQSGPIGLVPPTAGYVGNGQDNSQAGGGVSLADAVQSAHEEGQAFGDSVARDAPALWLEAVLARKPRMPSDLEARLLQGSALPIDFLLHDEVRHALRRGFWDALERTRR